MNKNIKLENMYVVIDENDFPMFPTVSLGKEDAKKRMVKLGPDKPWEYYEGKGYKVIKANIDIKEK